MRQQVTTGYALHVEAGTRAGGRNGRFRRYVNQIRCGQMFAETVVNRTGCGYRVEGMVNDGSFVGGAVIAAFAVVRCVFDAIIGRLLL